MWKGRFKQEASGLLVRFSESVSFDWRLYSHDIEGSKAHAIALHHAGLLSSDELNLITQGLNEIKSDIDQNQFSWDIEKEDVHMNIESELTRRIGPAGAKLHTARSRNDQVALDLRLYSRWACDEIVGLVHNLQRSLVACARKYQDAVMPGYTHLQRGQPVLWAHHMLAYVEMLNRDVSRIKSCRERLNVMPLGSGALAGSTIVLDRKLIAKELNFTEVTANSMDAVSDRDFIAELLFNIALCGIHLSRLGEDLILWSSTEFAFITLSDAHTTGSSLMPQKKNPDAAELSRGKSGRLLGNLQSILTTLKGLPLTYNRDLQEDKEPLFDSVDQISMILAINAEMIAALTLNHQRMQSATSDPMLLATDLADYLVLKGLPFRHAHEVIGKLTAWTIESGRSFLQMNVAEYQKFSPLFDDDVHQVLDVRRALEVRKGIGAPSPQNVEKELIRWEKVLS